MSNPHPTKDSSFALDREPDHLAQGQAALLLTESLIHSLLDNGALTKPQALEAIRSAIEVKEESLCDAKESEEVLRKSMQLLTDMRASIDAHSGPYDPAPDQPAR